MPELEIQAFTDEHLEAATTLLAERHRTHRVAEPLLPDVFDFRPHVEEAWGEEDASGWIAFDGDGPVGYLIGAPRAKSWGEGNVWVGLAGHAVREPEIVRDLYAAAAESWVERGISHHYAIVPATDSSLVDAWFRLSFGAQHAHGIREVPEADTGESDFVVRRAGADDAEIAAKLDLMLPDFQRRSPVFGGGPTPGLDDLVSEYADSIDDADEGILLVEKDGHTVGLLTVADVSHSGMHAGLARPERAAILGLATTLPDVRGSGAGLALTDACFAWAREHGYTTIVVDWRETNLRSSRFWPKRGFRRTFQRLYRLIP